MFYDQCQCSCAYPISLAIFQIYQKNHELQPMEEVFTPDELLIVVGKLRICKLN
jgi:hypothetical protein